jgi:hypothetical protein
MCIQRRKLVEPGPKGLLGQLNLRTKLFAV